MGLGELALQSTLVLSAITTNIAALNHLKKV